MPLIAAGKKAIRIYELEVGRNELQKRPEEIG
jgi:hypothetical protein